MISLEVKNLELLHFYTTTTCFTLSSCPELQHIWQQVVPRIAFTHHFLLHGILAFSALHLACSQPDRKTLLYTEASAHHNIGLGMFRNAISDITPQNCDACFTFSAINAAYAWASSDQTGNLFFSDTLVPEEHSNLEWASLLRGVYTLLKAAGGWMASGSMTLILQPRYMEPGSAKAADPEVGARLTALSQLWDSPTEKLNVSDVEVLNETLALLIEACGLVALSSIDRQIDMILVVYGWPIKVPEAFFAMVKGQKPEALVLLAHYSLLLNRVDHLWYMHGMSRSLLRTIHRKIGKEWESWIAWPLQNLVLTEFNDQGEVGGAR
ncbi:hypothetical protein BP5796_05010 [Coleophoma crateriformis]|uniref:Uncharacterized protein n=1 Tax=Coleophoma crateriformis TaxID=565419 RepID=A0A3D8SAW5_9HELO|nr:hypothetical protein BP5796_05010 [Coleophoma crateriformis]